MHPGPFHVKLAPEPDSLCRGTFLRRRNFLPSDTFQLYDLRVEVAGSPREMVCNHEVGDYFELSGENLTFPSGQSFPIYPLAALLPLLPAKQRMTHRNDWMTSDTDVACPDPLCGAVFRITRTGTSVFRRSEVTRTPHPDDEPDPR